MMTSPWDRVSPPPSIRSRPSRPARSWRRRRLNRPRETWKLRAVDRPRLTEKMERLATIEREATLAEREAHRCHPDKSRRTAPSAPRQEGCTRERFTRGRGDRGPGTIRTRERREQRQGECRTLSFSQANGRAAWSLRGHGRPQDLRENDGRRNNRRWKTGPRRSCNPNERGPAHDKIPYPTRIRKAPHSAQPRPMRTPRSSGCKTTARLCCSRRRSTRFWRSTTRSADRKSRARSPMQRQTRCEAKYIGREKMHGAMPASTCRVTSSLQSY